MKFRCKDEIFPQELKLKLCVKTKFGLEDEIHVKIKFSLGHTEDEIRFEDETL